MSGKGKCEGVESGGLIAITWMTAFGALSGSSIARSRPSGFAPQPPFALSTIEPPVPVGKTATE